MRPRAGLRMQVSRAPAAASSASSQVRRAREPGLGGSCAGESTGIPSPPSRDCMMDASIARVPPTRAAALSVCAVAQRLSPGVDCGSLLYGAGLAWHPKFVGALFRFFCFCAAVSQEKRKKKGEEKGPPRPVVRELGDAALLRQAERREWRRHRRPHRLHGWLRHQATALWRRRPPHRPAWERLGRIILMAEGSAVSRAPFECVCGFTAGTSFAWEKHLALRNTPYSSVKHSRVIRSGGGDQAARRGPAASDFDEP
ncbi:MAG: hypothetical protein ACPIOQ_26985, partial [Promethearchaeia archaeon]